MKKLFILSFILFLTSELFSQQTSTAAIKQTINTMMDAMRKGDSTLLRSVLAEDLELQSVAGDKMGKVLVSTKGANDLVTQIGTPHADVYEERMFLATSKSTAPGQRLDTLYILSRNYIQPLRCQLFPIG
ncbi:MAG: hypothetical protein ACHQHN_20165 [Sphingobacteriales bacterium]